MNIKQILCSFLICISLLYGFSQNITTDVQRVRNGLSVYNGEINTGTARYIGMGGSMGALGGDLSAINTNPASSAVFIKGNATLTLGVNSTQNKNTFGNSLTTNNSNFNLNQGGVVFVADLDKSNFKSISFGVNFTGENFEDDLHFPANSNIVFSDSSTPPINYTLNGFRDVRTEAKGKVNFNVGTNYNDNLFLGMNLNYHYSSIDHSIIYSEKDDSNQVYNYNADYYPYSETAGGFSMGVGVIGKVNQNIRLGLAYNSPIWWNNIESQYVYYNFDTSSAELNYFDGDRLTGAGKVTASGAVVLDNFALNLDYNYHLNTNTKLRPDHAFSDENDFINTYVQNSSEVKIGAEYRIKKFRLRGGWGTTSSPFKDVSYLSGTILGDGNSSNANVKDLFIGKKDMFSAGLGYNFGNFYMDFAYQNTQQKYNYVMNGYFIDNDFYTVDLTSNLLGSVNKTTNNYILTLGWNF